MKKTALYIVSAAIPILLFIVCGVTYVWFVDSNKKIFEPTSSLPKNPAIVGLLQSVTNDQVVLVLQNGTTETFAVPSTTQIISQVKNNEIGKSLSQIPTGSQVLVQPTDKDKNSAQSVSVVSGVVTDSNPLGPSVFITGELLSTSTSAIVLKTATDPEMRILLTNKTATFTNVLAGQKGKSLNGVPLHIPVLVQGYTTEKGVMAGAIRLIVGLQ